MIFEKALTSEAKSDKVTLSVGGSQFLPRKTESDSPQEGEQIRLEKEVMIMKKLFTLLLMFLIGAFRHV